MPEITLLGRVKEIISAGYVPPLIDFGGQKAG